MAIFVGIASYARPQAFKLCIRSLVCTRIVKGIITAIDVKDSQEKSQYMEAIKRAHEYDLEVIVDISSKRRGSTNARNKILDIAEQVLKNDDTLVLYDDDYVCPGPHAMLPARVWLRDKGVGLVGGCVINLKKRHIDPDFYLNIMPGLADVLTKLTGFVFLDTKHGPRYVNFTTPLMAMRVDVIKRGIRYDPKYKGTGYREESDFQFQVRRLGYKIVYEPRFQAFHLCLEGGGNRIVNNATMRFYWKARNNAYFIEKHGLGTVKLLLSTAIIMSYALLHGAATVKAVVRGLRNGIRVLT